MKTRDNPEGHTGQNTQDSFFTFSLFAHFSISQFFLIRQYLIEYIVCNITQYKLQCLKVWLKDEF